MVNDLIIISKASLKKAILYYIKHYRYFLFILLFLPLIIICSPFLGSATGENFIFFKLFGVMRSKVFVHSIYLLYIFIILIIFIKGLKLIDYKNIRKSADLISKWYFFFTIFCLSSFDYLFWGIRYGINSFEFPSYTNLPLIINDIYNGVLDNDFFTEALSSTPRFITSNFLKLPTYIGIDWYEGIHLFTVFATVIVLPILFLSLDRIIIRYLKDDKFSLTKLILARSGIFLLIISKLILELQKDRSLMGWDSAFSFYVVEPDEFALIFGLLFLKFFFENATKFKVIIYLIFLATCTLFHVLYGLAIFAIMLLYYIPCKDNNFYKSIFYCLVCGIIFPIIVLALNYQNPNPLSPEKFINIYNLTTHAFHYKVSELFGLPFVYWTFCYLIQLAISLRLKNDILIKLSFLSILYFIFPSLIQFIGTEVYKIKFIGILGLNRLSAFNSFIFCSNSIIILIKSPIFYWLSKAFTKFILFIRYHNNDQNSTGEIIVFDKINKFIFYFFSKPAIILIISLLLSTGIWHITKHNPLENRINWSPRSYHDKYHSLSPLCDWIRNNIPKNAIIFVHHEENVQLNTGVSFAIKCFAQRPTFVDFAFPFNESYLIEWDERLNFQRYYNSQTLDEFLNMCDLYSVTHLLRINHKNKIRNYPSIWESEEFILHDINQLKNIK